MKSILDFFSVTLAYGDHVVLKDFNLHLAHGEKKVIMGGSGVGKTSLLRLSSGLVSPTSGKVVNHAQRTAIQFQEPRLLPNLTALQNINVILSDTRETLDTAMFWLEQVELSHAAHLFPSELSGGMAQRVALARALAFGGDLYLLDEPFRGLDAELKVRMMELVLKVTADATLLLITHDKEVAQYFGNNPLRLEQKGSGYQVGA